MKFPYLKVWLPLLVWGLVILYKSFSFYTGLLYYVGTIFIPFLIFVIVQNINIDKLFLNRLFNIYIITGIIFGLFSIIVIAFSGFNFADRYTFIWENQNILSAYLMVLFMFNLSFIINRKKSDPIYRYILSIILIILPIFLTQTRGVWMGIIFSILIYVIKRPKIFLPSVLLIGLFFLLFSDIIIFRILTIKNFSSDLSSLGRLQAWFASISLLQNNFLWGYGFDAFIHIRDEAYGLYLVPVTHSHNTYLRSLLEMGLIGSIFYYYFFIKTILYSYKLNKKDTDQDMKKYYDGFQLSFIGLSVCFIFEPYFSLFGCSTVAIWILISIIFRLYSLKLK